MLYLLNFCQKSSVKEKVVYLGTTNIIVRREK